MALKLTRTATEVLCDILLHTLQQSGLEKAELLEQKFFNSFSQLPGADTIHNNHLLTMSVEEFTIIYRIDATTPIILAILHSSRLSNIFKI